MRALTAYNPCLPQVSQLAALTYFIQDLARWEVSSAASQKLKMVKGRGRGRAGAHSIFTVNLVPIYQHGWPARPLECERREQRRKNKV